MEKDVRVRAAWDSARLAGGLVTHALLCAVDREVFERALATWDDRSFTVLAAVENRHCPSDLLAALGRSAVRAGRHSLVKAVAVNEALDPEVCVELVRSLPTGTTFFGETITRMPAAALQLLLAKSGDNDRVQMSVAAAVKGADLADRRKVPASLLRWLEARDRASVLALRSQEVDLVATRPDLSRVERAALLDHDSVRSLVSYGSCDVEFVLDVVAGVEAPGLDEQSVVRLVLGSVEFFDELTQQRVLEEMRRRGVMVDVPSAQRLVEEWRSCDRLSVAGMVRPSSPSTRFEEMLLVRDADMQLRALWACARPPAALYELSVRQLDAFVALGACWVGTFGELMSVLAVSA